MCPRPSRVILFSVAKSKQRIRAEDASARATRCAVISPALAGCASAVLVYLSWRVENKGSYDLSTVFALYAVAALGILGLAALTLLLAVGLVARPPAVRATAAGVGSGLSALGGTVLLLWFIPTSEPDGLAELLSFAAGAVLLAPLPIAYAASKSHGPPDEPG